MSRLSGENGKQCDKLRCLVVGEICEDEGFGVVLVNSVRWSAYLLSIGILCFRLPRFPANARIRERLSHMSRENVLESSNEPLEGLLRGLEQ
jgi:hypothetical protein